MAVWINEFHYNDFTQTDIRDFVEIAGSAGTDLTGWKIVLYQPGLLGSTDAVPYRTVNLPAGALADTTGTGFGIVELEMGLDDGLGGIALVDATGTVVEFISYEGTLTATDGPADGMTSLDVGVRAPESDTDISVSRVGTGVNAGEFSWNIDTSFTPGAVNSNQIIDYRPGPRTWTGSTGSEYMTRANWDPANVPLFGDTAVFTNNGAPTSVTITGPGPAGSAVFLDVEGFTFNAGAPTYTIDLTVAGTIFSFNGAGIINNSGVAQNLSVSSGATLRFEGNSTAANTTITVTDSAVQFDSSASQAAARIILNHGTLASDAVTIGSLEGSGFVYGVSIGRASFTVGSLNTSTAFSGILGLVHDLSFTKVGTGTLTLSGSGMYRGDTTVSAGTLQAGAADALAAGSTFIVAPGAVLDLNGFSQTIGGLSDRPNGTGGFLNGGGLVTSLSGAATLTIGGNNNSTPFSGTISDGLVPGAVVALTKIGVSTQTLTGTSNYSGATTIDGGILLVDGSLIQSATTVHDGGKLAGSGLVRSVTVDSGGYITPGTGFGALTTGDLTLGAGAYLGIEIGGAIPGAQYDRLIVLGAVTLAGSLTIRLPDSFDPTVGTTFSIIDNDGTDAVTGTFLGLHEGDIFTRGTARYSISYKGGDGNDVVLTAVSNTQITVQGTPDIVTANANGDNISVLPGDGQGGYAAPTTLATGNVPAAIAVGDLDGDGDLDMVVTNELDHTVSVLLGNGLGGFTAATNFVAGNNPRGVTLGDLNGDGVLDIVTANIGSNSVGVLLGDGTGGFATQTTFAVGSSPSSVALADLNNDGRLDIVAVNSSSNDVSVLLGDGDGGFAAQNRFAVGPDPVSVALGDINHDGILDIVTANSDDLTVSLLLGDGFGGFGAEQFFYTSFGSRFVALGDVNNDGNLDIVTVNGFDAPQNPQLRLNQGVVLLGNGAGGFASGLFFQIGEVPVGLALGDVNGDGKLDIITGNRLSDDAGVLLGNGTGIFTTSTKFTAGAAPVAVALGDFDSTQVINEDTALVFNAAHHNAIALSGTNAGDETLKLTVGSGALTLATTAGLTVSGNGTGTVTLTGTLAEINAALDGLSYVPDQEFSGHDTLTVAAYGSGGANGVALATKPLSIIVDAVNDAPVLAIQGTTLDIVTANLAAGNVSVLLGNGAGGFAAQATFAAGDLPSAVALGDLNGDGTLDIVATNQFNSEVSVLFGDGLGGFAARTAFAAGNNPVPVALGDINGDGHLDIVVGNGGTDNTVSVLLGNGAGGFAAPVAFAAGAGPTSVALGDVDGDGDLDIVAANQFSNTVSLFRGNGAGGFAAQQTFAVGAVPRAVALGDVDRDGTLDIVVANELGLNVGVLLGDGDGGFAAPTTFATGDHPTFVALRDVNHDGKLDIVTADTASSTVSVLLGNGAGGFAAPTAFATGILPLSLSLGDVNGDGHLDILTAQPLTASVSLLLGDGTGGFAAATTLAVDTQPMSVVLGDLQNAQVTAADTALVFNAARGNAITLADADAGTSAETLTLAVASGALTLATTAGLTVNGNGTASVTLTGTVTAINAALDGLSYAANPGFMGRDTLTINANDNGGAGGLTARLSVPIIVADAANHAPVAQNASVSGTEDAALNGTAVASDAEHTPLSYALVGTNGGALHGRVTLTADGTFAYTPDADFNGTDSFAFKANDGTFDSNVASVTVTVAAVNDAPVNTPGAQDVGTNIATAIAGLSVADIDAGSGTLTTTLSVAHGTLTVAADHGAAIAGNGSATVTLTGTLAQIDAALGAASNVVYLSQHDFTGSDTLTMTTDDDGNTGSGGALADTDQVAITVSAAAPKPAVVPNDFSGNGHSGILWQNHDGTPAIWSMNGTSFVSGSNVGFNPGAAWHVIGAGDFNGDGKSDILWQHTDGTVAEWFMDGTSLISGASVAFNPGAAWHAIGTGDFNGDGKSDILWQNADGTPAVWLMDGLNILSGANVGSNPGTSWHVIGAGDFDGDGKSDILWQNSSGQAAVWLMNGTSLTTGTNVGPNPGSNWHAVGTGDFNGDGKADILWQNADGTPAVWLMNGTSLISGQNVGFNPGTSWHAINTGDYNGDGKSDILWQNNDGTPAVWLMNGTSLISGANVGFNPGTDWHAIPQHHELFV